MTNSRFLSNWGPLILLALGALWIPLSATAPAELAEAQSAPAAGFIAPDFALATLEGDQVQLSDLRGQAVLVNLWASWCGPCRAEMPAMQRLYNRYQEQGFEILAVNATNQDNRQSAEAFAREHGLSFSILLDVDGAVSAQYHLRALPSSFFIGPDGVIQDVVVGGPMAEAFLAIRVEQLLEGRP